MMEHSIYLILAAVGLKSISGIIVSFVLQLENIKMPIITTEKDAVKIKDFDLDNIYALKLRLNLNCRELLDD